MLSILVAGNGRIKIADFGLARVKQSLLSFCQTSVGTLNWQAPELWTERPAYNHKVDIYAAGLVTILSKATRSCSN
jgi:serine/threonine protein kinase